MSSTRSGSSSARPPWTSGRRSASRRPSTIWIGEKLLNFLRVADQDAEFAGEVPKFVEEIRQIFDQTEIRAYLDEGRRVGPLGHTASDEAYGEMRDAGAIDENPVEWAEEILLIERAKRLLLV